MIQHADLFSKDEKMLDTLVRSIHNSSTLSDAMPAFVRAILNRFQTKDFRISNQRKMQEVTLVRKAKPILEGILG